jgi:two-component system cell cycle response regulator DivK
MANNILVVDDQPLNLELLVALLESHGYSVQTAWDAPSALESIQTRSPDLILMDLQLPGLDGYGLTRQLKADSVTAHIPIIAVTSYAMAGDKLKALAAGCNEHVAKPIDTRTFPEVVARFLSPDAVDPDAADA